MAISGTVTRHPTVVTATMTDAYSPSRPYRADIMLVAIAAGQAPAIRFTSEIYLVWKKLRKIKLANGPATT